MILDGKIFSYNLKYLLEKNGIRNVELAKHLGVSKSAISNYISGASIPKLKTIANIALFFDVGVDDLLKDYLDKPRVKINEEGTLSFSVPFFCKELLPGDVIYRNDNYQGEFSTPFPIKHDSKCYAVMVYDNDMSNYGISKRNIAIFCPGENISNGNIAAVKLKSSNRIIIRSVIEEDDEITLLCKKGKETYKKTPNGCEVVVLGKVLWATFNPRA